MNVSELSGTLVCNALTAVKSPAPNDCGQSVYGCCPDGVTEASGPDYAGCQQKDAIPHGYCVETEFGCCPDGVTAARGPSGRGCPDAPCYVCTARRAPVGHSLSLNLSVCTCGCLVIVRSISHNTSLLYNSRTAEFRIIPAHSTEQHAVMPGNTSKGVFQRNPQS